MSRSHKMARWDMARREWYAANYMVDHLSAELSPRQLFEVSKDPIYIAAETRKQYIFETVADELINRIKSRG